MLGFGELLAHEWAFRLGWNQTNVSSKFITLVPLPQRRHGKLTETQVWPQGRGSRTVGPGVEMRDDPIERRRRNSSIDPDLQNTTSLE